MKKERDREGDLEEEPSLSFVVKREKGRREEAKDERSSFMSLLDINFYVSLPLNRFWWVLSLNLGRRNICHALDGVRSYHESRSMRGDNLWGPCRVMGWVELEN